MSIGHHTMDKGNVGTVKVIADLTVREFTVLLSVYEQMPFDLVLYKDGKFCRVQVKYRTVNPNGCVEVKFRSTSVYTSGKKYSKPMDKNQVDMLAIYCPDTDTCYYLDPKKFGKSVNLRVRASKMKIGTIRMADDYREPSW